MGDDGLRRERDGGVAILRLDRPQKRNALDSETLAAVLTTLDELAADDGLRALVFSTTSTAAFCAGADVGEQLDAAAGLARMRDFTRLYATIDAFPVPVITVCVGHCVGAGAEIVAGSDLRVAGDNLRLAWPGARLGVPVGPARLVPLVGLARAKDWIFSGRPVDATEAQHAGLVGRVVAPDRAESTALELASSVAAAPAANVRALKAMFGELDRTAQRTAFENDALLHFQEHGGGIPYRAGSASS